MLKTKKITHKAIKGSINAPIQAQNVESPTLMMIRHKFYVLEGKHNTPCLIDPVTAKLFGGVNLFMERIIGTTHFLSNNRKMIYDVCYADLYLHDGKVPKNHLVVENMLLRVEDWCHIDDESKFLMILDRENKPHLGMQFFTDDKLYCSNVPFTKSESMRNELLKARNDGTVDFFSVLKVKNPSGNVTEFHTKLSKETIKTRRQEILNMKKHGNVGG